ncbi:hypothetical protein BM221_000663 [Beauveria bassiana]|uniref:Uncharacterized protein n=1 Tax=Beauveria bassiana TaxID=176275 RepID=A0A2N6P153_BEABA|nr:hypothetical protein BM221_000663 [Beauveria bassiana]
MLVARWWYDFARVIRGEKAVGQDGELANGFYEAGLEQNVDLEPMEREAQGVVVVCRFLRFEQAGGVWGEKLYP